MSDQQTFYVKLWELWEEMSEKERLDKNVLLDKLKTDKTDLIGGLRALNYDIKHERRLSYWEITKASDGIYLLYQKQTQANIKNNEISSLKTFLAHSGEDRQIVPSPRVRTYDLQPEMSAYEVTEVVLERLESDKYDVLVVNFANPDMVGHSGLLEAAVKAGEAVDECIGKILSKVKAAGGAAIVTADHGNFEKMVDSSPDKPHTAHTVGDVPLVVFNERYKNRKLRQGGRLADVGPTLLEMMGLAQPEEMTGQSLLKE